MVVALELGVAVADVLVLCVLGADSGADAVDAATDAAAGACAGGGAAGWSPAGASDVAVVGGGAGAAAGDGFALGWKKPN